VKRLPPALQQYCRLVQQAPVSLTGFRGEAEIARELVEDALVARTLIGESLPDATVDVGSGNGSPGLPLALVYDAPVTLVESVKRKAAYLAEMARALGVTAEVVAERSETFARGAGRDRFALALARALAPPPVAAELGLPLVRPGGRVLLWTGEIDVDDVAVAAARLSADVGRVESYGGRRLVELCKTGPTPDAFPRRPGMARKRPRGSLPSQR